MLTNVEIGFLEKFANDKYSQSQFFPSKVGGKPSWLALTNIPTPECLKCGTCNNPTLFLAQIYAPFEHIDDAFHRTVFIFICKNKACTNQEVKVFRNQLPRSNKFYSFIPPSEDSDNFNLNQFLQLCSVCGSSGPQQCAKCKKISYCSRAHQVIDWKREHKQKCGTATFCTSLLASSEVLFKEFEITMETEVINDKEEEKSEAENLAEYEKLVQDGQTGTLSEINDDELLECTNGIEEDKVFTKFMKQISYYPEQVVRYERNGIPLWISSTKPTEIPRCEYCNSERQFEFQILPQIIYELKEDDVDFGTLDIYTCSNSCSNTNQTYKREYVFKQIVK